MMRTKRWLALMLTVVMVISMIPATAAAAQSFAKTRSWSDGMFSDISADDWYYSSVKEANELGLMSGDTGGTFRPDGQVTLAETITVAARIHSIAVSGSESFVQGTPWYQVYVDYCLANGILSEEPADLTKAATRLEFARILAKALPESDLEPINTVDDGAIPDVADDAAVYLLYRAGILTGNDAEGTFAPESSIKRSEVSAIVARMALPEQRKAITLTSDVVLTVPADDDEPSAPAAPEAMPEVSSIPGITFIPQVPAVPDSGSDPAEPPAASVPNEPSEPLNSSADTSVPFDLQYPDLIAEGAVDFSSEKITIKLESEPSGAMQQQLQDAGVTSLELLFDAGSGVWYIAYITGDVSEVLASVREIDGVISAEYDYAYSTQTIVDCEEVDADVHGNGRFGDQWYLRSCGIQHGWKHLKRHHNGHRPEDGSDEEEIEADENVGIAGDDVIVAVIDTGVDYTHPDLIDNIWVNPNEIADDGIDNDKNGYKDDVYGVDITTGKGSGMDDNGHGTHVAGIIAAANNNMGVVGVAYNAKIMPIKAGQASGYFNATDIAKAIIYAHDMGAQVINMSFGGIAMTSAVEEALAYAFTDCVLVAAAGNDGMPNEDIGDYPAMPSYPAAYSYVLGVMSVDENGIESGFTNWDVGAFNSVEYELYAPGSQMISTIPGGKYATWSGTSMAAPVVSGIAALLRANFYDTDTYPTRFIYGQLAATGTETAICCHMVGHNLPKIVDAYQAMTVLPNPEIGVYDYMIFDTEGLEGSEVNNGDGIIDAGETIAIGFTLKNRWGKSNDTTVTVNADSQGGIADPRIEVLTPFAEYGSVGTYSTGDAGYIKDGDLITGLKNPIYLKIADDCPNDAIITLNVTVTATNGLDENDTDVYSDDTKVNLDVRNGVILPDLFTEDTVLEGGKLYIIPNATVIHEGVTVTVKPGARIQFWADDEEDAYATKAIAYLDVEGTLLFEGTADEPIEVFPSERFGQYRVAIYEFGSGTVKMWHTKVVNPYLDITYAEGCEFTQNYTGWNLYYRGLNSGGTVSTYIGSSQICVSQVKDSAYLKLGGNGSYSGYYLRGHHDGCIFVDSNIGFGTGSGCSYKNCVFLGNNNYMGTASGYSSSLSLSSISDLFDFDNEDYPVQIVTNEETGTTYLAVFGNDLGYNGVLSAQSFAENLGGTLACINTQEELDFICEHFRSNWYYVIGLEFDSTHNPIWVDGTEFDDFLTVDNTTTEPAWAQLVTTTNSPIAVTRIDSDSYYTYCLFELPGEIYVQNITLAESEITLDTEDESYLIEATLEPATAEYDLLYSSADESVATVSEDGIITPENGWTEDETYTLTIPAKAFRNIFDVATEACSFEITIDAAEEADEETGEEESASESLMVLLSESEIEELAEEESEEIEETEEDRFYWTAEKFEAAYEDYLDNGVSGLFSNNAIINRTDLVVDRNVERWLRIAGASSSTYGEHPISGNYWGTTNEELIGHQIVDYNDYKTLVDIHEGKYLTEAPEDVWPFVVDAWLTNKYDDRVAEVGNETLTFHVKFNRDMDTSIPLNVRFGSDYPYADYSVSGKYEDSRNWKGTITLSTFIAGGYQCWTISNGRAADETFKKLYTDWGRFAFKVDTAAAMAMTLQAEVADTGIKLTWTQDDFDTLAGYNVYRSENGPTGLFTRLNSTIIPAGEEEFFDDNVEPGKEYCYNFTVVQTDMSESQPSNAVTVISKDTMPPSLIHTPVAYATEGNALTISAVVTDNLKLDTVQLHFRAVGSDEWIVRDMTCLNDKYSAIIQSHELDTAGMEYFITAYDGVSTTYKGSADEPYAVTVRESLDNAGLGDVNGDGAITILDAYRVLQAANGQVNITDEKEFARADLNGNGMLSSAEALRILMYVNGDVGTLKMDA